MNRKRNWIGLILEKNVSCTTSKDWKEKCMKVYVKNDYGNNKQERERESLIVVLAHYATCLWTDNHLLFIYYYYFGLENKQEVDFVLTTCPNVLYI